MKEKQSARGIKPKPVTVAVGTGAKAESIVRGEGRARILRAALSMFADSGFDAVSTSDIAGAASTSQSVVLYHFGTKEQLWREAMRELFSRVDVRLLLERHVYKDLAPADRMKVLLRSFVTASAKVPQLGRVMAREGLNSSDRLRWLIETLALPQFDVFTETIAELKKQGRIKGFDPMVMTLMIHGAGATLFNLSSLSEMLVGTVPFDHAIVQQQSDMLVDAFFGGLVTPGPGGVDARP